MESIFNAMDINFKYFLGKKLTLKTVEHALCEFYKYWRAVQGMKNNKSVTVVNCEELCFSECESLMINTKYLTKYLQKVGARGSTMA